MIEDNITRPEYEAFKTQKRTLENDIDKYIKENKLQFTSEPTELERLEFLNLINNFIDSQPVDSEIKKNVKKWWSLTFSPMREELRNNFLKEKKKKKEELLGVYQNRIQ